MDYLLQLQQTRSRYPASDPHSYPETKKKELYSLHEGPYAIPFLLRCLSPGLPTRTTGWVSTWFPGWLCPRWRYGWIFQKKTGMSKADMINSSIKQVRARTGRNAVKFASVKDACPSRYRSSSRIGGLCFYEWKVRGRPCHTKGQIFVTKYIGQSLNIPAWWMIRNPASLEIELKTTRWKKAALQTGFQNGDIVLR